jgi:hypothetical protein
MDNFFTPKPDDALQQMLFAEVKKERCLSRDVKTILGKHLGKCPIPSHGKNNGWT